MRRTRTTSAGPDAVARPLLLSTRAPRETRALAALLAPAADCLAMPLQATRMAPRSALAEAASWASQAEVHVYVSRSAVAGARRLGVERRGLQVAVGRATALALAAGGPMPLHAGPGQEDSDGILALPALQQVAGLRVAIYAAPGGRTRIAEELGARGAVVRTLMVYRRYPLRARPAALRQLQAAGARAVLSATSVSLLQGLDRTLQRHRLQALRLRPLIVASPRIAAAARALGWSQVCVADGASASAFALALRALIAERGSVAPTLAESTPCALSNDPLPSLRTNT